MVLFRRKAVDFIQHKPHYHGNMDCWEIVETGELFDSYEAYLSRRDYYHRKVFTCEITGRSGLNFYEALSSEVNGTREIKSSFPESLRLPVLREVHHRTDPRLAQLVSHVYDKFKDEYYPGEHVHVVLGGDQVLDGRIREKRIVGAPGMAAAPIYTLTVDFGKQNYSKDVEVENHQIRRDRKSFTKNLLTGFLRDSLTKEAWHGSPWCVKESLALEFSLPLNVPDHLQQSVIVNQRRTQALQKKMLQSQLIDAGKSMGVITEFRQYPSSKKNSLGQQVVPSAPGVMQPVWNSKPGAKGRQKWMQNAQNGVSECVPAEQIAGVQTSQQLKMRLSHYSPHIDEHPAPLILPKEIKGGYPKEITLPNVTLIPIHGKNHVLAIIPPQPKFPTEDLDVPPKEENPARPALKSFTDSPLAGIEDDQDCPTGKYDDISIGSLLEVWNTLNVHNEVFVLDSFTFDDLAQAIRYSSPEYECELLTEIHCAVLKQFVSEEGKLLIDLPKFPDESSSEDSESEESEDSEPEPEPEPYRRNTRSSVRQEEAKAQAKHRSPTPPDPLAHRAQELQAKQPWQEKCQNRDFRSGAWQAVVAGFLYQLSLSSRMEQTCKTILHELLPLDEPATDATITSNYRYLDVNLRLKILEIMTKLTISTKAVREHLESMSQEMTELRKRRVEEVRARREVIDEYAALQEKRKTILKEIEDKKSPEEKAKEAAIAKAGDDKDDIIIPDALSINGDGSDSDASQIVPRSLRKRKREEEAASQRPTKSRGRPVKVKQSKEEIALNKVIDEIEKKEQSIKDYEEKIEDICNDLRETECQRTKCLGKDRFCNRYWWYEHNGMPYGGVPSSSTAEYGYANGRIWVQGPFDGDVAGIYDVTDEESAAYTEEFGVSITQRRELEEGPTHLKDANHYGYIDTPEELDLLIAWLDERGKREKSLKKELTIWRETIVECMEKLKAHVEDENTDDFDLIKPITRVSTRTKHYADLSETGWTCLKWQNTTAVELLGMKHGEGKKTARRGVAARKVPEKKAVGPVVKEKIQLDRRGKPLKKR